MENTKRGDMMVLRGRQKTENTKHHEQLWSVCRDKQPYLDGTDTDKHNKPDCSCGCIWFHPLEGRSGMDWGVCFHPSSSRSGLLTFEHMGCQYFATK